jgi:hypothetical protein
MRDGAIIEQGGTLAAAHNWITTDDPGFLDASSGNFTLRHDAEATRRIPGFPRIDFDAIGPRKR